MKFNKLINLLESQAPYFNERKIYDFYTLSYLWQTTKDNRKEISFELSELKDYYLIAFKPLIINQLYKYWTRERLDIGSYNEGDLTEDKSFAILKTYMESTYRSDMKRRNVVWNKLVEHLSKLEVTNNSNDIVYLIDRINNVVHNTGTSILDKFENYSVVLKAFKDCHEKNPDDYRNMTSKQIKYLF
jgi:hypothetical protein